MSDVLMRICMDKREHIAKCKTQRSFAQLEIDAKSQAQPRGFQRALNQAAAKGYGLIAEIKKASPSKGLIRSDFHPPALARAYQAGGATCLSVLTDKPYFQGEDADLVAARKAVSLPVLRKDFMLDPYQIIEARALGADCILLIMAALEDGQAAELEATAFNWGMDVLIEVHNKPELERALRLKSKLIGVNNRNLKTLAVDLATAEDLAPLIPSDAVKVGESGLNTPADLARLSRTGTRCFLVGESLMRQADVTTATKALLSNGA